ncbi:MAG: hypothetical protein LBU11_12350 [Zoogloeaceae bacterium]|jgi:hypothetical protein|nr:hypothetical protein [Zoogloeaceae bacterium]
MTTQDTGKDDDLGEEELARARGDLFEPDDEDDEDDEDDGDDAQAAKADEDEDDGEDARDEEGEDARDETRIPKSRFDEAVAKEREARQAAEERLRQLEDAAAAGKIPQGDPVRQLEERIDQLEDARAQAEVDGDFEKVKALGKELRGVERALSRVEAERAALAISAQTLEQRELQLAVAQFEASVPQFNPDSKEYDADLVELVLAKQQAHIRQGKNPARALNLAAGEVVARFIDSGEEGAVKAKGLGAAVGATRKAAQVARNVDTSRRQPAAMGEAGANSDAAGANKRKIAEMSDEEFEKLSERELATMRGDTLR